MGEGGCQDNSDHHQQTDNDEWQQGLEKTTPTEEGREGGGRGREGGRGDERGKERGSGSGGMGEGRREEGGGGRRGKIISYSRETEREREASQLRQVRVCLIHIHEPAGLVQLSSIKCKVH